MEPIINVNADSLGRFNLSGSTPCDGEVRLS